MTSAFLYHVEDHQGRLLADAVRWLDTDGSVRFLPISTERTMNRLRRFLRKHHPRVDFDATGLLPLIVIMDDLSGRRVHTHRILHGAAINEWFRTGLTAALAHHPEALPTLRSLVVRHIAPPTLHLVLATFGSLPALTAPAPPAVVESGPGSETRRPADEGSAGASAPAPPPPAVTASRAEPIRRVRPATGIKPRVEERLMVHTPADAAGVEAWQDDATVPERRSKGGGKTVNISEAIGHAKMREQRTATH